MTRTRVAVIGVGHLGKEHAHILSSMPDVELVGVADVHASQAQAVALRCNTQAFGNHQDLLDRIDAAVVAVPTTYHRQVASELLECGIHCLVEKPLAPTLADALALRDLACKQGVVLQVGHIERFNPAWEELATRPLRPKLINSERFSPFTGRSTDIGVVLDMMIHDLDLMVSSVSSPVLHVEALGIAALGGHEDMVQARLRFEDGCVAHLRASRVHSASSRHMQLWGAEGFADIDFARRTLTLVQPSATLRDLQQGRRSVEVMQTAGSKADFLSRHLQSLTLDCTRPGDQLTAELHDFVVSIRTGTTPRVSGEDGCRAIALAERILQAVATHRWDGHAAGPIGPHTLPTPQGHLFVPFADTAAA